MTIMYCPECKTCADCKSSKNENGFRKDGENYLIPRKRAEDPFEIDEYEGDLFWHARTRTCGLCDHERRTAELDYDKLRQLMEKNERLQRVLAKISSLVDRIPEHA